MELWRHCVTGLTVGVQTDTLLSNCSVAAAGSVNCTHWIVCRLSCGRGSAAVRGLFVMRDVRRDPSSTDDPAGLEALDYWTDMCDRARRKTDARLFVSNEYLSCRFGCIIEPTGFIMNKHTYIYIIMSQPFSKQTTHVCVSTYSEHYLI